MKNKLVAILMLLTLAIGIAPILRVAAVDVTLTLPDAELATQFSKDWGPATVTSITDIPGPGVRFNFTGLGGSGTGVKDNFPVSQLAGGAPDNIGGWGDFRAYTQYRLVFTNLGPNPVSVNIFINTGWTQGAGRDGTWDTYWENGWVGLGVGESKIVTLDFSNAICWNAQDDPVPAWRYPGGTSGVIVRRLSEVSAIGFQVCGNGAGSIVVSQTIPKDVAIALPDEELSTQFAKETGPGTVSIFDIPGLGVRFDFSGLSSSTGTVVGDNFPVSTLVGGAWKDYGSGFSGPYDFSGYAKYTMLFKNVGTTTVQVNLKLNTGWTSPPWGSPERDTFWQNSWTTIAPGESRVVTLDFWSAEVYNAGDDPVPEWRYSDGSSGVIVRRLDEVSDIGFQVLGGSDASLIIIGEPILTLSDAELGTQFAKETGPGTVAAITDISGPGVRFDFSGLSTSVGTVVGDNFPVSTLVGGAYKTYGVTNPFSTWGDFFEYTKYKLIFTNIGQDTVTVNLKVNTGWTIPPPEYAAGWRDTFWQNTWTSIDPGESKVITLDFNSSEVWNAGDEQEYKPWPDGTAGIPVWRLDEVSDIGFQILGDGDASIIVSAYPAISEAFVDDDYNSSTPGWGYDHFAKIQDGVDAVIADGIVHVYDGTYNEGVVVNKNGLHILASSSPIVDGTGIGTSGFLVMADYVEIGGFIIQNFQHATFDVAGIELRGANHCWIHNNEIRNNNHGILFGDSTFMSYPSNDYNLVEYNTIHDNLNSANPNSGNGIKYWYGLSSHNTIYNNTIYNHKYNGILVGQWDRGYMIGYGGHTDWQIIKNYVNNSGIWGIAIVNGLNSKIEENTIENSGWHGIFIEAWDYAEVYNINVTNNIVKGSGVSGICIYTDQILIGSAVHDVSITYNKVYLNVYQGILTQALSAPGIHHLTIEHNEVYWHGYMGMLFYNLTNSKISYNDIYGNAYHGIYMFENTGNNEISYNKIHNNIHHGIKVITNGHVIRYNEIENNGEDGIFIDSDNNVVERNKITGNTGPHSGIHLTSAADGNQIHYNCIVGNFGTNVYGVYKEGGSTVNATYNWWGDSAGPYHPTKNPLGAGNQVSDYVLFEPWLKAYFDYFRKYPVVDEPVTFDATLSTKPCNIRTIVSYTWNFDDGTGDITETDPIIIHAFAAPRTYNVTLKLTYDDTTTATEWALVYVSKRPYFKVEPDLIQAGMINKTFSVNITINDLDVNLGAVGFQFRLSYNATLLEVTNVTQGPFTKDSRWNLHGTFFIYYIEDETIFPNGTVIPPHVIVGIVLLPNSTGQWEKFPYGSGTLATITFKTLYQEKVLDPDSRPPLTCDLTLFDTMIVNYETERIPHDITQNSLYKIYATNLADVNGDYYVGIDDITYTAEHFGESPDRPRWDPRCDMNGDNYIGIDDIVLIASSFGWAPKYDP
jgi:parallel beta-helix repeat protein